MANFDTARELCKLNVPTESGWNRVTVDGREMELPGGFTRVVHRVPVVGDLIVTKEFMAPNYLGNTYGWVLSVDPVKNTATIVLISLNETPKYNIPFNFFVIGERPSLAEREVGEYDINEAIRRSLEEF